MKVFAIKLLLTMCAFTVFDFAYSPQARPFSAFLRVVGGTTFVLVGKMKRGIF